MNITTKYEQINDWLTHLAFLIWGILACYFFQERLYSDTGFYLAKVVYYETFWVELSRFVLIFSEWLPLLCLKLGFSMKIVLLSYSLGHVLFFYAIYWIGRYQWNHHQIGWCLIAVQTIGILHGFCSPGFELYYVSAFMTLFAVILNSNDFSFRNKCYLLILTFVIVVNYLLMIWVLGGILALHFATHKFRYWKQYLLVLGTIITAFILKKLLTNHSYEIGKMEQFMLNLTERTYSWNDYVKPLLYFYINYYKELWLIVLITLVLYIKERRYATGVGFLLFLMITQYIVALTYPGIRHSRYQEQCYFPLIYVACFPLIMDLSKVLKKHLKWSVMIGLFILISYRFVMIVIAIEPFVHRVNYIHRIIDQGQKIEGNKFIAYGEGVYNPTFAELNFSIGMESILLSGLYPEQKTIQIIRNGEWLWQDSANVRTLDKGDLYMFTYRSFYDRMDSMHQHKAVDTDYFNFPAGKYRYLNGRAAKKNTIKALQNVLTLEANPKAAYKAGSLVNVPMKITNIGALPINTDQIRIAYHWWKGDKIVHWEGIRSILEVDLLPKSVYEQYFLVKMPEEVGTYQLQIDVVTNDELGWMQYPKQVPVQIY